MSKGPPAAASGLNPNASPFILPGAGAGSGAGGGIGGRGMNGVLRHMGAVLPAPPPACSEEQEKLNWYRMSLLVLEVTTPVLRELFLAMWNRRFGKPPDRAWSSADGAAVMTSVTSFNGRPIPSIYLHKLAGDLRQMDITALRIFLVASNISGSSLVPFRSPLGQAIGGQPDGISQMRNTLCHSTQVRLSAQDYHAMRFKILTLLDYLHSQGLVSAQRLLQLKAEIQGYEEEGGASQAELAAVQQQMAGLRAEAEREAAEAAVWEASNRMAWLSAQESDEKMEEAKQEMEQAKEEVEAAKKALGEAEQRAIKALQERDEEKGAKEAKEAARLASARRVRVQQRMLDKLQVQLAGMDASASASVSMSQSSVDSLGASTTVDAQQRQQWEAVKGAVKAAKRGLKRAKKAAKRAEAEANDKVVKAEAEANDKVAKAEAEANEKVAKAEAEAKEAKQQAKEAAQRANAKEWEAIVRQAFVERKAAHKGASMTADSFVELDEAQQAEVERRFQVWVAGKEEEAKAAQEEKEAAEAAKAAAELEERRGVLNYEMARRVHVHTAQQRGESLPDISQGTAMTLNAREEAEVKRLVKARLAIPDLEPNTYITGVFTYEIAEDQDAKLKGGQGRIYKGYAKGPNGLKVYVAIKSQIVLGGSGMRREADIYFRLVFGDFPHLLVLSDVLVHPLSKDKVPLLVTEWAEHGTLSAWMDKHVVKLWGGWEGRSAAQRAKLSKLYLPKVLAVAVQMARGLASLHELKPCPLVHQDAKPGNVLMYPTERGMPKGVPVVKFADFGMCGASNEFGAQLGGTCKWMSPEQMRLFMSAMEGRARKGEAALDPSFDVWALGLMLAYIFGPATRGALEEYQRWLRGEYDLGAAAGEMARRAQAIVSSAEAECEALRGADERVGKAWEAMVCVLKACLGEGRLKATAGHCEELLQQSYELLSSDGGRFGKVKLSSTQAELARTRNKAFRPKELQAVFDEKVLGNWRTSGALLLEQVAMDLRLPQTSGGVEPRTEREVLQALLKALPHRDKYDARLLPLAMDVVRNMGSLYTLEEEDCVLVVAIGQELQRQWQRSNTKEICSRRLGVSSDSHCPFLRFSRQGLGRVVRGMLEGCGADDKARQGLLRAETYDKFTPLHKACQGGHVKVAEALLAACGADDKARQALLRAEAIGKATPLHCACIEGHVKVAEFLLAQAGSDHERMRMLTAKAVEGISPAALARYKGHTVLADKLDAMCQVEAHSLSGATHLNGKVGRVVGLQGEERLGVDFGPPLGVKALRPGSLRWPRERQAAVGGEVGAGQG